MDVVYVDEWTLRKLFNAGDYPGRANRRELTKKTLSQKHPAEPLANEPVCTLSQLIGYLDTRSVIVATCHQYKRKDGTIGLSGKCDPKMLVHEGKILTLSPDPVGGESR